MIRRSVATKGKPITSVAISSLLLLSLFAHSTTSAAMSTPTANTSRPFDQATFTLGLEPVADGFERPVDLVDADDGSGRLFVVEQAGRVLVLRDGDVAPTPFLDITDRVGCCGERGLLSLAFHPDFAANGYLFVDYTYLNGNTQVVRFTVSATNPEQVNLATARMILTVEQPASNHNGGRLVFGPDGFLYISLGDGGGGNGQNGQKLDTLLGKLLRIDVDHQSGDMPYAIPSDNPFVETPETRPEIWAYGLRNPWRFDFDRETGNLWIGDVGSSSYEEVNLIPAGSGGGQNFGWDDAEGFDCRATDADVCANFVSPITGFDRSAGCVVTGGTVYRGAEIPELVGVYLFADYCGGGIWGVGKDSTGNWITAEPVAAGSSVVSFGQDARGELYVVDLDGSVSRIVEGS